VLKFSMILEAVDRFTGPAKRAQSSSKGLVGTVRRISTEARKMRADVDSGRRSVEWLERTTRRNRKLAIAYAMRGAAMEASKLGRKLDNLVRKLRLTERAGRAAGRGLKWAGGKLLGAAKWGLAAGVAAGGFALFNLFGTAGKFEQYKVQLEGIEGSAAKAKKAMNWVQDFAEKTPFELDQVMEAFVALKAYGLDPLNGSLLALGDGAAGMSKPLMQAVEALADATTGEFERLKEFGIRASKQGERVTFSYRQNGKEMRREAAMTGGAIEEALTGIFSERFGGGMVRQSKTLFGILSNIKDLWSKFLVMIADAGIFDKVKGKLDEWRSKLDVMAKNGRLKKWAQSISDMLEKAFEWGVKFAEETDWKAVGEGLAAAVEMLVSMVTWLGKAKKMADDIAAGQAMVIRRETPEQQRDRRAREANDNTDDDRGFLEKIFTIRRTTQSAAGTKGSKDADGSWKRAPGAKSTKPQKVAVGGKVGVQVSLSSDLRARLTQLEKRGDVPVEAKVGRTMRSAA